MLVCWEWLSQYTELNVEPDDMATRFAMSGLNHESTVRVDDDIVIDLEVTSNRGDCLGHIGVAREAAVLLGGKLKIPAAAPAEAKQSLDAKIAIENRFPQACPQYTARVIQGVKIGPSPEWLSRRLKAVGIASVNNVVDVTNYVMLECGQPLHAFDLAKIAGGKIVIRPAQPGEELVAIDHRTYQLDPQMIVIADAERAIALGGVMGGADSEVSEQTVDLLIEAAAFEPLPIRRAARKLKLHSPSSFRFERRPDLAGLDWASRRCCELILEVAGGQLLSGCASDGSGPPAREAILFRRSQIQRVLGIDIEAAVSDRILTQLGCQLSQSEAGQVQVVPPSWRGDLTREVDLIEEVARIHGYEQIPEDVHVPLTVAATRPKDIALKRARHVLSAFGIDEAMTPSIVGDAQEAIGSVWTERAPLATETPLLVGAKLLRRSLLPSLLGARLVNQAQSIRNAQLYEIGTVYLPAEKPEDLPVEQSTLGIVAAGDLRMLRGTVEEVIEQILPKGRNVEWQPHTHPAFQDGSLMRITDSAQTLGYVGIISSQAQKSVDLDQPVAAAELNLDALTEGLEVVRRADPVSPYPAVVRDLNFVVDESLTWTALSNLCRESAGPQMQSVVYQETYRNPKKDGADKKRILLSITFQSLDRTLTSGEVDEAIANIVASCQANAAAQLLA